MGRVFFGVFPSHPVPSHGTFSSSIVLSSGPEYALVCGREVGRADYKIKKYPGTNFRLPVVIVSLKGGIWASLKSAELFPVFAVDFGLYC